MEVTISVMVVVFGDLVALLLEEATLPGLRLLVLSWIYCADSTMLDVDAVVAEVIEDVWVSVLPSKLALAVGLQTSSHSSTENPIGTLEQKLSPLGVITAKPGSAVLFPCKTSVQSTSTARTFREKAWTWKTSCMKQWRTENTKLGPF